MRNLEKGYKTKILLIFCLFIIRNICFSQVILETFISDTLNVEAVVKLDEDKSILDTFFHIKNPNRENEYWKVYYSSQKDYLVCEFFCLADSCFLLQYYPNGKLKRKIIEIEGFKLVYEELRCEQGQLIRKVNYSILPQKIINFYCNGKKKNEFIFNGYRPIGHYLSWHANGQLKMDAHFDENGNQVGVWKYYNELGKLIKEEEFTPLQILRIQKVGKTPLARTPR